jgi:hypothetical protein
MVGGETGLGPVSSGSRPRAASTDGGAVLRSPAWQSSAGIRAILSGRSGCRPRLLRLTVSALVGLSCVSAFALRLRSSLSLSPSGSEQRPR